MTSHETIRVLLANDQRMFREALRVLLELEPDMVVVAEATTGREAVDLALEHDPDVVLLDIEMPDGDGLEAARALRERGSRARCLIVTTFGRPGYLQRALESGVAGFVVKDTSTGALCLGSDDPRDTSRCTSRVAAVLVAQRFHEHRLVSHDPPRRP